MLNEAMLHGKIKRLANELLNVFGNCLKGFYNVKQLVIRVPLHHN